MEKEMPDKKDFSDKEQDSEENKKTFFKKFLSFIFFILVVLILVLYWFFPFQSMEFNIESLGNSNFTLNATENIEMQFYKNMRYPNKKISYKITDCSLAKQNNLQRAFDILENRTILEFYSVNENEKISITCSEEVKTNPDTNFFIAGEGGPTNITETDNFNVILNGKVLLLRESKCSEPNVGLHELLHALGFEHSSNPNNIMYSITKCSQTLGDDIPALINELYSYPSYADLKFEDASASTHQRYLDLNMSIRNHGLKKSGPVKVNIYIDNKSMKELDLEEMEIGRGRLIFLQNFLISKLNINEIKLIIETDFPELDKKNNEIVLKIKE